MAFFLPYIKSDKYYEKTSRKRLIGGSKRGISGLNFAQLNLILVQEASYTNPNDGTLNSLRNIKI